MAVVNVITVQWRSRLVRHAGGRGRIFTGLLPTKCFHGSNKLYVEPADRLYDGLRTETLTGRREHKPIRGSRVYLCVVLSQRIPNCHTSPATCLPNADHPARVAMLVIIFLRNGP